MKKVLLLVLAVIVVVAIGVTFYLLNKKYKQENNIVRGEIINSVPTQTDIKSLTEKYPLDVKQYAGITVSNYDNSILWIFGIVSSLKQEATSPDGTLIVNIRGQEVTIKINAQTRFSKAVANAKSLKDTQYEVIRSGDITAGDSVFVTAQLVEGRMLASEVQKRI